MMSWFQRKERVIERVVEKEKIVEKEVVRYLLGDVEKVTLYRAYREEVKTISAGWAITAYKALENLGLYHSCAQAFEENPGCKVETKTYWKIGGQFVRSLDVATISLDIKPKPKRGKGKA